MQRFRSGGRRRGRGGGEIAGCRLLASYTEAAVVSAQCCRTGETAESCRSDVLLPEQLRSHPTAVCEEHWRRRETPDQRSSRRRLTPHPEIFRTEGSLKHLERCN